jgi:hypothetical protein
VYNAGIGTAGVMNRLTRPRHAVLTPGGRGRGLPDNHTSSTALPPRRVRLKCAVRADGRISNRLPDYGATTETTENTRNNSRVFAGACKRLLIVVRCRKSLEKKTFGAFSAGKMALLLTGLL